MSGPLASQKDSTAESSLSLRKQVSSKSLKNTATPMGGRPKGQTTASMKRSTTIGGQSPNSKSSKGNPGRGLTVRIDEDMPALRQSIQSAPVKVIRRLPAAPMPPVPPLPQFIVGRYMPSASTSVSVTSASTPSGRAPPTPATAPATFGQTRTPRAVRPLPCPPACASSPSDLPSTPTPTEQQQAAPTSIITPTRVVRPLPIPKFNTPRRNTSIAEPQLASISPEIASPNSLQSYRSSTIDLTPKKKTDTQNIVQEAIIADGESEDEDDYDDVDEKESTDIDSLYGPLFTDGTIDSRLSSLLFSRNEDVDSSEETSPIGVRFRKGLPPHAFHHRPRRSIDSNHTVSSSSVSEGDVGDTPETYDEDEDEVFLREDDEDGLEDSEEGYIDYARILSSRVLYRQQQASYDPQFHSKWALEKNGKRYTQQDISDVLRALRTL